MKPLAVLCLSLCTAPLLAQGPGFQIGHVFTDPSGTSYRLGWSAKLFDPVGAEIHGVHINSSGALGNLWGAGADLSFFRSGNRGLYVVGGAEGGVADGGTEDFRGSLSAGLGYEFFPLRGLSLSIEGRQRWLGPGSMDGVEMGIRLGYDRGSRQRRSAAPSSGSRTTAPSPEQVRSDLVRGGVPVEGAARIGDVVRTALDVMGTPYQWGGEGQTGFDCSGLIQYAYGQNGVTLPRRSTDQAREGVAVPREMGALRAGDILTFANDGSSVSHVGLYVGDRKFIHSASAGVQVSVLSDDDVSGRWWYQRWVGARRILP